VKGDLKDAVEVRENSHEIVSATDIVGALDCMASDVTLMLSDQNPLVIAVMRGGAFTAVELCHRFNFPYEFDFIHITRYGKALTGGDLNWKVLPSSDFQNRTVLVVDDVLDEGITLKEIHSALERCGVSKIYFAVLVKKKLKSSVERMYVDFVGVEVEDVYIFGCGLDYKGYWRGLKALYALDGS
jgi:hypoxanthine phosphoribosyltransferase